MRILVFLTIYIGVLACNGNAVNQPSATQLMVFLDSFNKANAKYYNYESTEEWGDSLLKASFIAGCRNGRLLKNFPLIFHDVGRSLEGQPYAHFIGEINDKPGWSINFDVIVPFQYEQINGLLQNNIYQLTNVKSFTPVTQAWIYKVELKDGVIPYVIRENGKTKIVSLGANYADAIIEKK